MDELLSIKDASKCLACSEAMLRKWAYFQRLPTVKLGRGSPGFDEATWTLAYGRVFNLNTKRPLDEPERTDGAHSTLGGLLEELTPGPARCRPRHLVWS